MTGDKGLRAFEALCAIRGHEEMDERTFQEKCVPVDPYDPELWEPLYEALEAGAYYGEGFRGTKKRERIDVKLWSVLLIDPDEDVAAGGEFKFVGVRFFENVAKPHEHHPRVSREDLEAWLDKMVATGRLNQNEAETAARDYFRDRGKTVDREDFRKIYTARRPKKWTKTGPRG